MKWLIFFVASLGLGLASSSYDHYRLPTAIRPQKYHLSILTHLDGPKALTFSGTVKILLEILENTNNITLHSKGLTIDESQTILTELNGEEKQDICVSSTEVNPTHDYYILNTCQELVLENYYELTLSFSAEVNRKLVGYYRSSYPDPEANETRWITMTQFEPASARLAFPCFDEPSYKASFLVTLGHHQKYTSLSNMPVKESQPHELILNYVWTEFQESVPMSTYLVAYSINDFYYKPSILPNGVHFRTWARPNAIDQCDYAAEFGPKVLQYYEELFGIRFPLPKIDQIAMPDFESGAMENWGLVTYRETNLLYSNSSSSLDAKELVASVVAHELAHQWFGNLVTMKWWTDLWLNEGFATYLATMSVHHINPEGGIKERQSVGDIWETFRQDSLETSNPISRPIQMASQIVQSFNVISYKKGSSVIRMMHLFLGDEAFRAGLKTYLEMFEYSNAEQDNLWETLTQAAHESGALPRNFSVKTIMDTWTLQTGYPVVNVIRNYAEGNAELTQERYLRNSEVPRSKYKSCWWVPLSYTTQSELDFNNMSPRDWLECSKEGLSQPKKIENLPRADQWVILNTQVATPCKINYDAQNWKLLINTLTTGRYESIHLINRAQLINDVLSFAWTGDQDYETALKVVAYLPRERELLPWKAAFSNIRLINRIVRRTAQGGLLKRYIKKLLPPIYHYVNGINDTFAYIQHQDGIALKISIVSMACQYQVEDCIPRALNYFREWRTEPNPDKNNPVPVNLRSIVYCTAIRHGLDEDWEFLWTRYKRSNEADEKVDMLNSLGCTRAVWLLRRMLDLSFDPKSAIRRQDSMTSFNAVADNEIGFQLAKQYFMHNVELIYKFYQPTVRSMLRLLTPLSTQIIDPKEFREFEDFVSRARPWLKGIEETVQQTLEKMRITVQWKERNYAKFNSAIRKFL
ncbi:aminopeptidase N-like [Drosophila kikkawai]|uniref:Aminopeptidase n=1 Tax=Drosophila kikkawai TaxID=30033 RepID=A0A6P4IJN8_DROKI|nr:aminopeptidase N-like [Drosophila kikkawai]XP_017023786.1 aminopeptidase N-like [Drosophila kikkawai]